MKQAALDKFWEALEKVKDREWHLSERGCIRALSCFCPLEVIGPHGYDMEENGHRLGLSYAETWQIAHAADRNRSAGFDPAIRARMLQILNLQEAA